MTALLNTPSRAPRVLIAANTAATSFFRNALQLPRWLCAASMTKRPVLHAVLGWHPSDLQWLTGAHLADTVRAALKAMGLREHQSVWVTHTDTGRPHVHIVANLAHPDTGIIARLGLIKKRMSAFCAAYEQGLGDVRCKARLTPRAVNENRSRQARAGRGYVRPPHKQKASNLPAPRP